MNRAKWTLVAVLGATFMLLVDITIVQVALPRIRRELHASFTGLAWVIDAYALTLAALLLTSGSLADRFGRKRVFIGGVGIFTLASLLCGLATTPLFLGLARALQGVGGAAMFATSLALIGQEFSGRARATAIALWSATVGGAVAVGPLIGGALTEWLGWEWIFFVNIPVGALVLLVAAAQMENRRDPGRERLDLPGLVTFSGFLFLLVFALLRGHDLGWGSRVIAGSFVGAAALLCAFVVVELRSERPMFDLGLFRSRVFTGVQIGTFAIGGGMFALFPYLTLYLQNVLGFSPLQGGLRLLPVTVMVFIVPLLARRFAARIPAGVLLAGGLAVITLGVGLMYGISVESEWTALLLGMIVAGIGIGLCNPSIAQLALSSVPAEQVGLASGVSNTFRIGGLATGVAAFGALLQYQIGAKLHEYWPRPPKCLASIASSGVREAGPAHCRGHNLAHAAHVAFDSGLNLVFVVSAATVLVGAVAVALLVGARAA